MSSDHAKPESSGNLRLWVVLVLVIAAFAVATRLDPLNNATGGGSGGGSEAEAEKTATTAVAPTAAVASTEIPLPDGPNINDFQDACLLCHSARLPLGQPPFGREKWGEIVHKMAAAYGAPLTPEVESKVVNYIVSVRPPQS